MRALISGAGVGGLSAAIALKRKGYEVVVFEQADELRITGAGLNLWPNSVRALYGIGLQEKFDKISVAVDRYLTIDPSGEVLHKKDVSDWRTKYGAPAVGIHRRTFTEMLAEQAGYENIKFGYKLVGYEDNGDKVKCHFSNGETVGGDLLIGADGIHSQVRQSMQGQIEYHVNTQYTYRWRGIVSLDDVSFDPLAETEVFDDTTFFGTLPIGNGKAYWFASGPKLNNRESFEEVFRSWKGSHVPHTISVTPEETIIQTKLMDLSEPPKYWVKGNVALLGDAVHSMMPDMAQGASQTTIDAFVLGECLEGVTKADIPEALKKYESIRKPVAEHVVEVSRRDVSLESGESDELSSIVVRYEQDIEGFEANK